MGIPRQHRRFPPPQLMVIDFHPMNYWDRTAYHGASLQSYYNLAEHLRDRGRPAEALPFAEQAWLRRQRGDTPPGRQGMTAMLLSRVLWAASRTPADRTRARTIAERAIEEFNRAARARRSGANGALAAQAQDKRAGRVQAWLEEHPVP